MIDADLGIYTCGRDTENPPSSQYIIDVSQLRDPQSNRGFKRKYDDGRAGECQSYVAEDPRVTAILDLMVLLTHDVKATDKNRWISFVLQDYHGKWIAPAVGELARERLKSLGYNVALFHYELTARTTP